MSSLFDFSLFYPDASEKMHNQVQGKQNAKVLVIVQGEGFDEKQEQFLAKILEAVKLHPLQEKVQLLHLPKGKRIVLSSFLKSLEAENVLLFGVENLKTLGLQAKLPFYYPLRLGQHSYIRSHALAAIQTERSQGKKEKAAALWKALKIQFL